ncbi:efflux RND transporter permease subunit [Ornithobacterium rhinotracheale]|uniref:efflux RND transporter permease subunit n=1 Tax=Ornithobacterium rhinotracheale TaxID=28251 RepID=UPI0004F7CCF5|nr:efflux RND transporter permease subunit [Ornithobacterium rhinotracheale]AIP98483.1 transporter [Ornithobacterium rhinotracheale ORT-UMN 88]MBN3663114.1 MMPL family transporter [Ornithobacterium rhinotracheale]MCK0193144.1 MMPL family transporter [Ornithobacterium rhinotracheale]UOH63196.1 MMPL family transporter [Ornithobacterium rhinotracheale]UOH66780.1 MMPL family transporter [Ornithobacterium rhinotracheale]
MWNKIASFILRNRAYILISLVIYLVALVYISMTYGVKFSTTSAQLLPSSDPAMVNLRDFQHTFGNESNVIVIGYDDEKMHEKPNYDAFKQLQQKIATLNGVKSVFSMEDAIKLVRDTVNGGFKTEKIISPNENYDQELKQLENFPFYNGILYNTKNNAKEILVYIDDEIMNSPERAKETLQINDWVEEFEEQTQIPLYLSGMPVIRTMNSQAVKSESFTFIGASLLVTCLLFLYFYRSLRNTLIAVAVVACAVTTCFALMAFLGYDITILTALVPPLLIVIGIPNCIYLINKYQKEYVVHKNKIKALHCMIVHVGNAAILTNLTTAFGFFTFLFTDSKTLQEFGIVSSLNIVGIFFLSFLIVPTLLSYFPEPKEKELSHLSFNWTNKVFLFIEDIIANHRKKVYLTVAGLLVLSFIGISLMKSSGNILDDMSKNTDFYKEISFFDKEFGGVLPLEIVVDTKRPNGVTSIENLQKLDQFSEYIDSLNISSKPLSIVPLVKMAKQAYYNNDSAFYQLPTRQERSFILGEIKKSKGGNEHMLNSYLDSTKSKARVTTLLSNMDSDVLAFSTQHIQDKLKQIFPDGRYKTYVTGMAFVFQEGTKYLTHNLFISISIAILMISVFMAFMFRSPQMVFIALLPNILPLLTTAGFMGYLGIPIKPSTILVFSIAFGIAVDDTIHFLARYRQDLKKYESISLSVAESMEHVGSSMFYTSVILFAGFGVFMFSGFNGIVALGGLVVLTLLMAMFANLILLPSLLLTYERFSNKEFSDPKVDLFKEDDDED